MQKPASFETGFDVIPPLWGYFMGRPGIEPGSSFERQILSLLRMPVSPPALFSSRGAHIPYI